MKKFNLKEIINVSTRFSNQKLFGNENSIVYHHLFKPPKRDTKYKRRNREYNYFKYNKINKSTNHRIKEELQIKSTTGAKNILLHTPYGFKTEQQW